MADENQTELPQAKTDIPQQATQTKKPSKLPTWVKAVIVGGIGFTVLMIGLVIFGIMYAKDAIDTGSSIIGNIQTSNCAEVYDNQATAQFQSLGSQDQWVAECERIAAILTGDVDLGPVNIEGDSGENSVAQLTYAIDGSDDMIYDVTLLLEKVDGEWKLDGFNSESRN